MNNDDYNDSECNILLYDINKKESYDLIKELIRMLIKKNSAKVKKIYNLFSLNSNTKIIQENDNNDQIKKGKDLACEIGANFSVLNINENYNNITEEVKNALDNIFEQIIDCINKNKKWLPIIMKKEILY
jgi:hypothetical protein